MRSTWRSLAQASMDGDASSGQARESHRVVERGVGAFVEVMTHEDVLGRAALGYHGELSCNCPAIRARW